MQPDDALEFATWGDDARGLCEGRSWHWRAAVLLLLAWQAIIPFRDSERFHVFRGITFGAHEFGHLFFAVFGGEWLTVADARAMELDLVSFSPDGGEHDWNYLLGHAGMLMRDQAVARIDRFAGFVVLVASLLLALWLLRQMANRTEPEFG